MAVTKPEDAAYGRDLHQVDSAPEILCPFCGEKDITWDDFGYLPEALPSRRERMVGTMKINCVHCKAQWEDHYWYKGTVITKEPE